MYGGEVKLIAFDQKDAGFNAAKIDRDPMNDEIEQFVQFQNVGNLLSSFLQGYQGVNPPLLKYGWSLTGEKRIECSRHGGAPGPQSYWTAEVANRMRKMRCLIVKSLFLRHD
jgi:hypothetical protein